MMVCHGLCDSIPTFNRYTENSKFCAICGKHLKIINIGPRCPCCHASFRTHRRYAPNRFKHSLYKRESQIHRY